MSDPGTQEPQQKSGLPQLQTETFPSQIFWLLVHLVVLYLVITRFAIPRIESGLEARRRRIEDSLARAEKAKADAVQAAREHQKLIEALRAEAQQSMQQARTEAMAEHEAFQKKAHQEIEEELATIERRLAEAREAGIQAAREATREVTGNLVEQLTDARPSAKQLDAACQKHWRLLQTH